MNGAAFDAVAGVGRLVVDFAGGQVGGECAAGLGHGGGLVRGGDLFVAGAAGGTADVVGSGFTSECTEADDEGEL